jgi:hypothetical protein
MPDALSIDAINERLVATVLNWSTVLSMNGVLRPLEGHSSGGIIAASLDRRWDDSRSWSASFLRFLAILATE